jgi:hypothetical protein
LEVFVPLFHVLFHTPTQIDQTRHTSKGRTCARGDNDATFIPQLFRCPAITFGPYGAREKANVQVFQILQVLMGSA